MHGLQTCCFFLHSAFMPSMVKMPPKGEVGGHALNSHGNNIADQGKSWKNRGIVFLNILWEPCVTLYISISETYIGLFVLLLYLPVVPENLSLEA